VERWLLKVLIGTLLTERERFGTVGWKPPDSWLRVVFNGEAFAQGTGLYFATLGQQRVTRSIYVLPIRAEREGLSALMLRFWLRGQEMLLVPPDVAGRFALQGPLALSHRPDELRFTTNDRAASVRLSWAGQERSVKKVWVTPLGTSER
jgi:hypothetical protein